MTICSQCGSENRSEALFCRNCGSVFVIEPAPQSSEGEQEAGQNELTSQSEAMLPTASSSSEPGEAPAGAEQAAADISAGLPEIGAVLQGRYCILRLVSQDEKLSLYEAEDNLRCWSCQVLQTEPDPVFCQACGAELSQKLLVHLHATLADQAEQLPSEGVDWFIQRGYVYRVETLVKETVHKPGIIRLVCGFSTDTGLEREIDEDSVLALRLDGLCERKNAPALGFFAVADGMGGHEAGEVASRVAIHRLAAEIMQRVFIPGVSENLLPLDMLALQLQEAVLAANQAILELRSQAAQGLNMGCTLTAVLVRNTAAVVANVGDSRTYRMHGGKLFQVTRDHSMAARLVEQNKLRPEEIYTFENKPVIYRSLGDDPGLEVDVDTLELEVGDRLLLCSDGLWEMVRDLLIEDVLLEQSDPQRACERLVEIANLAGGEDNISVILADICLMN